MRAHVSLFGIPVRFDPTFLFLVLGLGYLWVQRSHGTTMFVIWIPLVTAAILVHELGHALVGRAFGLRPFIVLHGMGGLTSFDARDHRALPHGHRILITLAGPLAGIVLGGLVWLVTTQFVVIPPGSLAEGVAQWAVFTTLGWGVLNLVPMMPLDGGQIVATLLDKLFGLRGVLFARIASIVVAVGIAGLLLLATQLAGEPVDPFSLFVLGGLALMNWRAYTLERGWQKDASLEQALEEAYAALEARDTARVQRLAGAIRARAATPQAKAHAAHLLAWAHLLEGDAPRARAALEAFPAGTRPDAFLEGSVLLATGSPSEALAPLIEALVDRRDDAVADAVARAALEAGRIDELVGLIESKQRSERVGVEPLRRVAEGLVERGAVDLAGELCEHLFARFREGIDAFNAACVRARRGERARALALLEKAVDAGLPDAAMLDTDEDLAPLRGSAEMDALRRRAGLS